MHGNVKNFDRFIARRPFLNDNKFGADTLSPGKEFQADTTLRWKKIFCYIAFRNRDCQLINVTPIGCIARKREKLSKVQTYQTMNNFVT